MFGQRVGIVARDLRAGDAPGLGAGRPGSEARLAYRAERSGRGYDAPTANTPEARDRRIETVAPVPQLGRDSAMHDGTTRVLVADGRQMVAETLQHVIDGQSDMSVIRAITDDTEFAEIIAQRPIEVIVVGSDFAGDAVAIARRVRDERPDIRVVMLLDGIGVTARDAIAAGCIGVVSKDRGADDLCNAIRSAARGQAVASVSDLDGLFGAAPASAERDLCGLTRRQLEVLELMAEGCATADLAARLYVSKNTVRTHVQQVFRKLGARSRLEAVAIARRSGVLT
jgi:DNA-binding NarL/FixJ family response regulator